MSPVNLPLGIGELCNQVSVANALEAVGRFDTPRDVIAYFEKQWKYDTSRSSVRLWQAHRRRRGKLGLVPQDPGTSANESVTFPPFQDE